MLNILSHVKSLSNKKKYEFNVRVFIRSVGMFYGFLVKRIEVNEFIVFRKSWKNLL